MSLDAIWPYGAVLQFNRTEPGTQVASRESSSRSPSKRTKTSDFVEAANDAVIRRALRIMESRLKYHDVALNSPQAVRDYLRLRLADLEWEVFVVLFLDAQNRLIACEELFRGTLTQTSVYPREVVKAVLKHNAAAVIFAHNHPSGVAEPSRADELLTQTLKQALALIECKVLDHFVVAGEKTTSFAERGLL
jgi:DNA repair protein RadC